jgi:hypothetical protein
MGNISRIHQPTRAKPKEITYRRNQCSVEQDHQHESIENYYSKSLKLAVLIILKTSKFYMFTFLDKYDILLGHKSMIKHNIEIDFKDNLLLSIIK